MSKSAFDWTDVEVADALLPDGPRALAVRAVRSIDAVRAWYPERACDFRWTSRQCGGATGFRHSSPVSSHALMVCQKCATRAAFFARGRLVSAEAEAKWQRVIAEPISN